MSRLASAAVLLALGMTWGLTIPLTRVAVSSGHQPLGLIFWQMLIATVVLSLVCAVRRSRPVLNRCNLIYFLVVALLGTILPNSFSYLAAAQLPAGVMAIIIATVPMLSLAIALGIGFERLDPRRLVGVVLGALAVVLLVAPETSLPQPEKAVFVLVALIAPFCYGAEGNYIAARAPPGVNPVTVLLGASALGCLIAGPLAVATGHWIDPLQDWGRPEQALLLSALCHVVAYSGYIWLVGATGPVFASQIAYVVTLSGVALSALFLGETYSGWVWAALALMVTGLALVQPRAAGLIEAKAEA